MHGEHNHCHHALKVCEHCDTVYCTACKREWVGHTARVYWPATPYPYYGTTTISCDSVGGAVDGGLTGGLTSGYAQIVDDRVGMDVATITTHSHN
jgi:hypothetical protein